MNSTIDSVSYPDAIIYPLIAHSQQYIYDATNNTDSGLNISTNTTEQTKRGVFAEDLKPAILVKHIIKAIEEQYSLTFKSGEFFDSTHVSNLYMWLHRDKGKIEVDNSITKLTMRHFLVLLQVKYQIWSSVYIFFFNIDIFV